MSADIGHGHDGADWQTPRWHLRLAAVLLFTLTLWLYLYAQRSFPFEDPTLGLALIVALVLAVAFDLPNPPRSHLAPSACAIVAATLVGLQALATRWAALSWDDAIHWARTLSYLWVLGYGVGLRWLVLAGRGRLVRGRW